MSVWLLGLVAAVHAGEPSRIGDEIRVIQERAGVPVLVGVTGIDAEERTKELANELQTSGASVVWLQDTVDPAAVLFADLERDSVSCGVLVTLEGARTRIRAMGACADPGEAPPPPVPSIPALERTAPPRVIHTEEVRGEVLGGMLPFALLGSAAGLGVVVLGVESAPPLIPFLVALPAVGAAAGSAVVDPHGFAWKLLGAGAGEAVGGAGALSYALVGIRASSNGTDDLSMVAAFGAISTLVVCPAVGAVTAARAVNGAAHASDASAARISTTPVVFTSEAGVLVPGVVASGRW